MRENPLDKTSTVRMALAVIAALTFCIGVALAEAAAPLSLEAIAEAFGIDEDDVEALRRGERIGGGLTTVSENELSLSMAGRTNAPAAEHWDDLLKGTVFDRDPTTRQYGWIGEDAAASLAALELPDAEIERLAEAEPGEDVNLSTDEIAALQAIAAATKDPKARRDALLEGFRKILVGRLDAYRTGGLGAVVPYDRGDGEVAAPAVELGRALGELHATRKLAPRAYDAIARFPDGMSEGVDSRFAWVVQGAEDVLIVTLAHRVFAQRDGHIAVIEHRFYVNHTVNSMQAVSVIVPADENSIAIYANRSFTDRVSGFGSAVARGIGRAIMRSKFAEVADAFEMGED